MWLAADSLHNVECFLYSLKHLVVRDNRPAAATLQAMNVHKCSCGVTPPNISHVSFDQLMLCGNNSNEWSLGRKHWNLSNGFFDIYGSVNAESVGVEVLMEVASFTLRLMTTIAFTAFEAAATDMNGASFMNQKALRGIYNWREANCMDFALAGPSEEVVREYKVPRCNNGLVMVQEHIRDLRGFLFPRNL